ncbi:MAG: glycosyltransferase family 87 protein [Desulfobaccales bacterium]
MIAAGEPIFGLGTALPWLYPPTFLLIILPLALLPYFVALSLWTLIGLAGYLWVVRRLAPHPLTYWLALAFPGTYQNLVFGQNGFLFAVLLGGGLLFLEGSPLTAGVLLGLLSCKPHLMVLVVLALVVGRYWRALLSAVLVSAILIAASVLVLKPEVWLAFLKSTPESVRVLQTGLLPWRNVPLHLFNMPTVFCAMLEAGAGPGTARILQGAVMLGVAVVVGCAWFRGAALTIRGSILVLGILLFTPYAAVYDLALLALPLACLSWDGYTRGWLPGEPLLLVLGWLMPLLAPYLALATHVQIAPVVLILLVILVLRRWLKYPDMTKDRASFFS